MKIINLNGVTKSQEITVSKSIGALIVCSDVAVQNLSTEKISVYVERANGSNVILANKIPLKDFILASTYGNEAIQSDPNFHTIALCELAMDGGIFLDEKEQIKILLEDLIDANEYELHGVEEPNATNNLYFFEQKTIASEEFSKKMDVHGFDLAIMTVKATIHDVSYTFESGQVVKYSPFELQTLSSNVDPVSYINGVDVYQRIDGRLSLPLVHVDYIEVNKSQGDVINFVVRNIRAV
ncbi:hypothetical protein [Flavobacterium sp. M31R6]|uniref:hypothetical protein n=1 Tax=Flavobacterium sp. M31R6 TaxID=2739062 RepID=UPI00156904AD|nr:hypothetical protein [Flavobacterium sp. M31R6]QKJ63829.1 hypothetical protein HQN62_12045 [Flavobacterium sp. M31R6]